MKIYFLSFDHLIPDARYTYGRGPQLLVKTLGQGECLISLLFLCSTIVDFLAGTGRVVSSTHIYKIALQKARSRDGLEQTGVTIPVDTSKCRHIEAAFTARGLTLLSEYLSCHGPALLIS